MMVRTVGGYMWMKRLVTLSKEWNTSEFRQVIIALASGPIHQHRPSHIN